MILALVALQIVLVGVTVLGTREQDLSVRRLESARAFYAAEGASNIAVREVAQLLDDDGDATVGSIALGSLTSGVTIGGSKAAASVSVLGTTYTITTSGQSGLATHSNTLSINRTTASTLSAGLYAEYYRLSSGPSAVASVPWSSTPNWVGIVPNANLTNTASGLRWPGGPTSMYGIRMRGTITIPTAGTWTFLTNSDDGSTLSINGTLVVNNDGLHAAQTRSGTIVLAAGSADFDLKFFENSGSNNVIAYWAGPGIATQVIPATAFSCTPLRTIPPICGATSLSIGGSSGTSIDGFSSASGVYGGTNITSAFSVATNSVVNNAFQVNGTRIAGNALVGPGGNANSVIQLTASSNITGTSSAASTGVGIIFQGLPASMPAATSLSLTTTQTLSSNARYSTMTLSGSGTLNISGNVVIQCDGNLSMSGASAINILPNSSLIIYMVGSISMANTAAINMNTGDPSEVRIYYTATARSFTMSDSAAFCGQTFNPGGGLTISGGGSPAAQYYGVFHGTTITTTSTAVIHADAAYGNSSGSGTTSSTSILSWRQSR
ncbi:MAG: PA14 domain-containing protein [Planctomycetota bacterium]|nr:PA14 domain-containing protein [Planctomycetota bacterium]